MLILWLLLLPFFNVSLLFAEASNIQGAPPFPLHGLQWSHVEKNTVFFAPESLRVPPYPTQLFQLHYVGKLNHASPSSTQNPSPTYPYFIFSAQPCEACAEDRGIYILNPSQPKPTGFIYPGKILDARSKALLLESQAFFGQCLKGRSDVFILFQREKVDRRSGLQPSVLIAEAGPHFLTELFLQKKKDFPRLSAVLQQVKLKKCFPIPGRNRFTTENDTE